jgi:L,D-peptidoglycan transpeptidase YkuD (ErfK/YbiS/YcfS/YnhG family)
MIFHVHPDGYVSGANRRWTCALGRGGIGHKRREGDGITPLGSHKLGRVFWRADRLTCPQTQRPCIEITKTMGWCDDPNHDDYNQLIELPHPAHAEQMWRDDHVYDVVVELLYNVQPIVPGLGSAIFMHIARPEYTPTEGCIALAQNDLLELLREVNENSEVSVDQR